MGINIKVTIPTMLRRFCEGQKSLQADGDSIADLFENLNQQYPGIKSKLFDAAGNVKTFINIYKNQKNIIELDGPKTLLANGDTVDIITAVAGG